VLAAVKDAARRLRLWPAVGIISALAFSPGDIPCQRILMAKLSSLTGPDVMALPNQRKSFETFAVRDRRSELARAIPTNVR
jgi:hypothetical protein